MIRYHIEKDDVYIVKLKEKIKHVFCSHSDPCQMLFKDKVQMSWKGEIFPALWPFVKCLQFLIDIREIKHIDVLNTPTLCQMSPILDRYTWNQTCWCSEHSDPLSMSPIPCQYTFKEKAYNNLPVGLASRAQEHTHLLRTQVAQFYRKKTEWVALQHGHVFCHFLYIYRIGPHCWMAAFTERLMHDWLSSVFSVRPTETAGIPTSNLCYPIIEYS